MARGFAAVSATLTLLALAAAPAASAESIVFLRDGNVWTMSPDGSGQRPVTTTGSIPGDFYSSVSQTDNGTIFATREVRTSCSPTVDVPSGRCNRADVVEIMDGQGRLLAPAINPDPCRRGLANIDASPDGAFIAYEVFPQLNSCSDDIRDGVQVAPAGGTSGSHDEGCRTPQWFSAGALLMACRFEIVVLDANGRTAWIQNRVQQSPGFPSVPPARPDRLAHVPLGFDRTSFDVTALSGPPPSGAPGVFCNVGPFGAKVGSPAWRPDGSALAYDLSDADPATAPAAEHGVYVTATGGFPQGCPGAGAPVAPGGSDPDWGPATPGAGGPQAPGGGTGGSRLALDATIRRARLARVLRSGLRLTATCSLRCSARVELRARLPRSRRTTVVGRRTLTLSAGRATTKTVRFSSRARRALRRTRRLALTMRVRATAGSERVTVTRRATLRR